MKNLSLGSRVHFLVALSLGLFLAFTYLALGPGGYSAAAWAAFGLTAR